MGAVPYFKSISDETPIGRGLNRIRERDRKNLQIKFNTVYYLLKQERPFVDYPEQLKLLKKNKGPDFGTSYLTDRAAALFAESIAEVEQKKLIDNLKKVRYYSVLNDGSTDSSVTEQELVYALFLVDGFPQVKFLSIESVSSADAAGILESIKESFHRLGITPFTNRIVGLNVDGASVNTGKFTGLGSKIKVNAPWLQVIHCFSHRLELAIKDAFEGVKAYESINEFVTKLYYLYQQSPKRLRCLRELAVAHEESIPKPTKAGGTRWIDHKYRAIKNALDHYGVYIEHIEELATTDSQPKKRVEIKGFLLKWKDGTIPVKMTIYLCFYYFIPFFLLLCFFFI